MQRQLLQLFLFHFDKNDQNGDSISKPHVLSCHKPNIVVYCRTDFGLPIALPIASVLSTVAVFLSSLAVIVVVPVV